MKIKRVPLSEVMAVIRRLEREGKIDHAELFKKAVYGRGHGRVRLAREATSHTSKIG